MLVTARIEELSQVADLVTMKQCSPVITKPVSSPVGVIIRLGEILRQPSPVNHEESVDIEHPLCVDQIANPEWKDGQRCWEAKGKCAQLYAEAKIKLLKELDQSRQESFREICVSLFMVGKTPGKAKPMIIISSEDKQSRKEAKKAIIRSGVLTDFGFEIGVLKYLPSGPIHPVAGSPSEACWNSASESEGLGSDTWKEKTSNSAFHSNTPVSLSAYYDSKQGLRITGMPIYVKTADGRSRMGTANVVHNGSKYGYITAAHIFGPLHQSPSSIDDDEDDLGIPFDSDSDDEDGEDDLNEKASFAGVLLSDSVRSRESHVFHADGFGLGGDTRPRDLPEVSIDLPHDLALLGHLESGQEPEKSLDCAIITIDDPELQLKLDRARILARNDGFHVSTSTAEPEPSLAIAWTTHGHVHGTLNKVPILMRLQGSMSFKSVYTFVYKGAIKHGDCGSLVLDTNSGALYGMIIAAADKQPTAYIVAAKALMNHVANAGWHLLDANDDYMNSNEIHDEEPQAQSRLQPRLEHTSHEPLMPEPAIRSRDKALIRVSGIGTYPGRGTLKDGCNPAEHTIVYFSGTDPASCYIPGEYERGMTKEPIEVVPAEPNEKIRRESRIRFGKVYPIEMNVKVKDIGRVREDQISALISYWAQENHTPTLAYTPSSSTAFSLNKWESGGFSSQRL
ncbi:uncharacterized protein J4E84_011079 [Alternaria hordeiaustralica]|uniref:uncharacterized protein n=1 Tax=Alternaria hordeiaustralica TaxID=1187925 RepID=UPI0020C3B73D|nr:uncharacterized protein J4E84_011079 [Alternaria hordeiaustralica]KAI4673437.1 hypothetical protein J4E84_011079 [Alternaria hordeiaustralica]